ALSRTDTVLDPKSAVLKSGAPSLLRSTRRAVLGEIPVAKRVAAPNVPVPVPSRIEAVLVVTLAVARANRPSPLTSATATNRGPLLPVPTLKFVVAPNEPVPVPSRTDTVLLPWFAVTTSSRVSPLKSARATPQAFVPIAKVVGLPKVPGPVL